MLIQHGVGGVIGHEHKLEGRNYQDSVMIRLAPKRFVGVLTDGMSMIEEDDGELVPTQSEYGAKFGASMISKLIFDLLPKVTPENEEKMFKGRVFWERVEADAMAHIRTNALLFGDNLEDVLYEYFMFTVLGVIVATKYAAFFALGDGNFFINGERFKLSYPENKPPFLTHRLISGLDIPLEELKFKVLKVLPLSDLKSFLVGTDGTNAIIDNEDEPLPGRTEKVGSISQFWTGSQYFSYPDAVEMRLHMMSDERQQVVWSDRKLIKFPGILYDDTTLLTGRIVR